MLLTVHRSSGIKLVWEVNHFLPFGEQKGDSYMNSEIEQIELPNRTKASALVLHWVKHFKSKQIWCLAAFLVFIYTFQFYH